jgi:hypothetical protein
MPYQCGPARAISAAPGVDYTRTGFFQDAFNYYSSFAQACDAERGGSGTLSKGGRLISTTQTARDIFEISKKVGDGRLRYWGEYLPRECSVLSFQASRTALSLVLPLLDSFPATSRA